MNKRIVIAAILCSLMTRSQLFALILGNFTAQDFKIRVENAHALLYRDKTVLDDQHYTDLGVITKAELPLTLRVWDKAEQNLSDATLLSEFIIEDVPKQGIEVNSSDIWLLYSDENGDLQITNVADQKLVKEAVPIAVPVTEALTPEDQPKPIAKIPRGGLVPVKTPAKAIGPETPVSPISAEAVPVPPAPAAPTQEVSTAPTEVVPRQPTPEGVKALQAGAQAELTPTQEVAQADI